MRKLKLQMQQSVDGFVCGPSGELDWLAHDWDDRLKDYVAALTSPVDHILLGRKTSEGFMPHWAGVAADPEDEGHTFGIKMHETQKTIFSRTLNETNGNNAHMEHNLSRERINRIKSGAGGDIILYGGAGIVAEFVRQGLIDEYNLFVNPAAIGQGLSIFKDAGNLRLKLISSETFECGIIALRYVPA
jgi:dihydrofolate reductase